MGYLTYDKKDKFDDQHHFKLCFIDEISPTVFDYTPESKVLMETEEYKEWHRERSELFDKIFKEKGSCSISDLPPTEFKFRVQMGYYTNPDFKEGEQEFYAYFTSDSLDKQWGDDWDDAPYEYNAEEPYDRDGTIIVKVPFYVRHDGWYVRFPKDYANQGSSSFCVRDINAQAVAWIFAKGLKGKSSEGAVSILAGITPFEFLEKIKKINEMYPYEQE